MALTTCKECNREISTKATACPHCGAKVAHTSIVTIIFGGLLALGGVSALMGYMANQSERTQAAEEATKKAADLAEWERKRVASLSPEQKAAEAKVRQEREKANREAERQVAAEKKKQDEAVQRAVAGAAVLKKAMRNPDSFKLESALVIDRSGAVCYDYRAQNGFGGISVGHAVLAPDGKRFLISENDGGVFTRLWNKECANKRGTESGALIRQVLN